MNPKKIPATVVGTVAGSGGLGRRLPASGKEIAGLLPGQKIWEGVSADCDWRGITAAGWRSLDSDDPADASLNIQCLRATFGSSGVSGGLAGVCLRVEKKGVAAGVVSGQSSAPADEVPPRMRWSFILGAGTDHPSHTTFQSAGKRIKKQLRIVLPIWLDSTSRLL